MLENATAEDDNELQRQRSLQQLEPEEAEFLDERQRLQEADGDGAAQHREQGGRVMGGGGGSSHPRRHLHQMTRVPPVDELLQRAKALRPGQKYQALQLLSFFRFTHLLDPMLDLFERLPELGIVPDAFAWNDVIASCIRERRSDLAMMYWDAMISSGFRPGHYIYVIVVTGFIGAGDRESAAKLLLETEASGVLLSTVVYRRFLNMLFEQRAYDAMRDVYERMGRRGVARDFDIYSLMIRAAAEAAKIEDVRTYFATMLESGFMPSTELMTSLVIAEYVHGSDAEGWRIINEFSKYNLTPPISLLRRVINEEDRRGNTILIPRVVLFARQLGYPVRELYSAAIEAMVHIDVLKFDSYY